MKKLIGGFFIGFVTANFLSAYSDGLFARAGTLLTKENAEATNAMSAGEIFKYLFEGAQLEDAAIPVVIREMREKNYKDAEIADHLGLDVRAVRLIMLNEPPPEWQIKLRAEVAEKIPRIQAMNAEGYSDADIAEELGVSERLVTIILTGDAT